MKITSHKTAQGEIITGARLESAIRAVAKEWRDLGHAIHKSDDYAEHVTQEQKDAILYQHLRSADEFEQGLSVPGFTLWQRLEHKLTGNTVAFLA